MSINSPSSDAELRKALDANGQRFTEQRAAVYHFLSDTDIHPTADEVFLGVRQLLPGISLATVYKSLEALVGCGLALKLTYGDGSARYDGRTDPHHHARCLACGKVSDVHGGAPAQEFEAAPGSMNGFTVTGYRLELTGYCIDCAQGAVPTRIDA
jgi:Fe2+ or Zn2+ uptake regulation protein